MSDKLEKIHTKDSYGVSSLFTHFARRLEGGIVSVEEEKVKKQQELLWSFIKNVGKNIFLGKPLSQISLPVTLFVFIC